MVVRSAAAARWLPAECQRPVTPFACQPWSPRNARCADRGQHGDKENSDDSRGTQFNAEHIGQKHGGNTLKQRSTVHIGRGPKGSTKALRARSTPSLVWAVLMDSGRVAALDDVKRAVIMGWLTARKNCSGSCRTQPGNGWQHDQSVEQGGGKYHAGQLAQSR